VLGSVAVGGRCPPVTPVSHPGAAWGAGYWQPARYCGEQLAARWGFFNCYVGVFEPPEASGAVEL
jgi:hypothetical protein